MRTALRRLAVLGERLAALLAALPAAWRGLR